MDNYMTQRISYRNFLVNIFKWLFIGLGITTLTSVIFFLSRLSQFLGFISIAVMIIASIIEIIMVIILSKKIHDLSIASAKRYFYVYSIINGITMSLLLGCIDPYIAVLAFALTVAYFGLLYAIASHTVYDFTSIGHMCLIVLPMMIVAYIILFIIQVPVLYYGIIFIDLALFTGITLYDMKKIKDFYDYSTNEELEGAELYCALELYLDFINIFIDILMLLDDLS